jgi:hypothetical protein
LSNDAVNLLGTGFAVVVAAVWVGI